MLNFSHSELFYMKSKFFSNILSIIVVILLPGSCYMHYISSKIKMENIMIARPHANMTLFIKVLLKKLLLQFCKLSIKLQPKRHISFEALMNSISLNFKIFLLGQWNLISSITHLTRTIKKNSHYLILLKKTARFLFIHNFSGCKKQLIKNLFNELKITLQQCLNKPLDEYYRQVVVYAIRLCILIRNK